MYFGGMPALIGMKYFTSLTILRIFEQDITNLKSLIEIASTLEELWICEGQLKDLSGIENCKRLRKVFLYDNQIEDASPLSRLCALETLHLMNNSINNLTVSQLNINCCAYINFLFLFAPV
uniref:Dynein assembly factor 1, axonemal homolog n=1 Tax=Parascaris equorum TaxID=6256 RepID=A0A914S484_PAREQ